MRRALLAIGLFLVAVQHPGSQGLPIGARIGTNWAEVNAPQRGIETSRYDEAGQADPFHDPTSAPKPSAAPPPSSTARLRALAEVRVASVRVTGILRLGSAFSAVLESPGGSSFVAKVNDMLIDARIARIDRDGVVFLARTKANDAPNREVRMALTKRPDKP